jgi:dihydropteroate synthase
LSACDNKKPILSSDVVRSLDTMHRAVAEVMAERGLIEITDAKGAQP